jgi:hypothetical protein
LQAETLRKGGAAGSGFGWVGLGVGFCDMSGEVGRFLLVFIELLVLGCWFCMFSREVGVGGSFSIVWDWDMNGIESARCMLK